MNSCIVCMSEIIARTCLIVFYLELRYFDFSVATETMSCWLWRFLAQFVDLA